MNPSQGDLRMPYMGFPRIWRRVFDSSCFLVRPPCIGAVIGQYKETPLSINSRGFAYFNERPLWIVFLKNSQIEQRNGDDFLALATFNSHVA